jgi:hypothetical protein
MNLIEEFKTPEVQWQINKNFRLAREFIREYLDDPGAYKEFANGNAIVLLPADAAVDLELIHANLQMAHQLAQSGRDVITYEIGTLSTRRPVYLTAKCDRR